jgi:poly(3-hydroxyalkanoate) synthetase
MFTMCGQSVTVSEDCLYLNTYTPSTTPDPIKYPYPVLVFWPCDLNAYIYDCYYHQLSVKYL